MTLEDMNEFIQNIINKFDLSYHIPFSMELARNIDFRGKRILEVGGCLPREYVLGPLQARQWIGLEEMSYWNTINVQPEHCKTSDVHKMADIKSPGEFGDHAIMLGAIEDIPTCFYGYFDAVISIAAFEHISRFPAALIAMYNCLRPGGSVGSKFSPIWSAHNGHHMPTVIDNNGHEYTTANPGFGPWFHLLMRPPQMFEYMLQKTDARAAAEIVYNVYSSPHINRLLLSDYLKFFQLSPFEIRIFEPVFPVVMSEGYEKTILPMLKNLYPGNDDFCSNGILAVLDKK